MMQPETWKVVGEYSSKAWTAVGPLVGVLIGAYIANRNQRKHWLADNKREEYREVLSAMNKTLAAITNADLAITQSPNLKSFITAHPELVTSVLEVSSSRLFVRKVLETINFEERFARACSELALDGNGRRFLDTSDALSDEVREAALRDIGF